MDDRQTKITEGAGREESRINEELLDFLNKWSTPVLLVIVVIAGAWFAWQRIQQARIDKINDAFGQLEAAMGGGNPSPDALRQVANSFEGVRGVAPMARLTTADLYLRAAMTRLRPGAVLGPDGQPTNADDNLDDEGVARFLDDAGRLYRDVLTETEGDPGKWLLTSSAQFGLGAVAGSRGELEQAAGHYRDAATTAEGAGDELLARVARERAEGILALTEVPELYAEGDLPALTDPAPQLEAIDLTGGGIDLNDAVDTQNLQVEAQIDDTPEDATEGPAEVSPEESVEAPGEPAPEPGQP
ncbi:MAG: hypothetical protein AAF995_06735 [Planctomycetota bacterium]